MVEQKAKKFGIDNNSTSGENTDATKTKTQGLHDVLAGFLSITGQGNPCQPWQSAEMQQQYANEIMTQILKIRQENA